MKTLVAVLMTALLVFAIATAWVDYVQPLIAQTAPKTSAEASAAKKQASRVRVDTNEELLPVPDDELASDDVPTTPRRNRKSTSPVKRAIKQVDATRSYVDEQLDEVEEREVRLAKREEALELMRIEIKKDLDYISELRRQATEELRGELAAVEQARNTEARRLLAARDASTRPTTKIATSSPPAGKNMTGTAADRSMALMLMELANEGKTETAINLLRNMKGRAALNIIHSIDSTNPRLAGQLADGVSRLSEAPDRSSRN